MNITTLVRNFNRCLLVPCCRDPNKIKVILNRSKNSKNNWAKMSMLLSAQQCFVYDEFETLIKQLLITTTIKTKIEYIYN